MSDMDLRASDVILMYIFVAYVLYLHMRTRALRYQLHCKCVQCAKLESYIKDKRGTHYAAVRYAGVLQDVQR